MIAGWQTARTHFALRKQCAFSLIEVLAAVAVLAFVYIALAEYAMRGLGAEGEAARRLEAATLADNKLATIETQLLLGSKPQLETQESDEDDFHITVDVRALAVELPAWTPRSDKNRSSSSAASNGPSFLAGQGKDATLRTVTVRVEWPEGRSQQNVSRTTIFFDPSVHAEWIESLPVRLLGKDAEIPGDENIDGEASEDERSDDNLDVDADFDAESE